MSQKTIKRKNKISLSIFLDIMVVSSLVIENY